MNPTTAAALRWGGAVIGLLLVVWFTVPAMLNAMQASVRFGDEDEVAAMPGEDAAESPGGDSGPADDGDDDAGGDGGDDADDNSDDGDSNGRDDDGDSNGGDDGGGAPGGSYVIQPGDTLFDIAEQTLGDGHRWPEVAELNGLEDGRELRVGQELRLPE